MAGSVHENDVPAEKHPDRYHLPRKLSAKDTLSDTLHQRRLRGGQTARELVARGAESISQVQCIEDRGKHDSSRRDADNLH